MNNQRVRRQASEHDNYLIHWKYVRRERIVGAKKGQNQWRYFYKEGPTNSSSVAVKTKNSFGSTLKDKVSSGKKFIESTMDSLDKKVSSLVTSETRYNGKVVTPATEVDDVAQKEAQERLAQTIKEKLLKNTEKKYKIEQDTERTQIREPELERQVECLTEKNIFGKYKNNPLPELPLKQNAMTLDEDMAVINENYDRSNPDTSKNCGLCTLAYDLRRRGYDVEAMEMATDMTVIDTAKCYEPIRGEEQHYLESIHTTGDIVENATGSRSLNGVDGDKLGEYLEQELLGYGEGARGELGVYWTQGGGHSVAWEVENNMVVIRDCQTNKKYNIRNTSGPILPPRNT